MLASLLKPLAVFGLLLIAAAIFFRDGVGDPVIYSFATLNIRGIGSYGFMRLKDC